MVFFALLVCTFGYGQIATESIEPSALFLLPELGSAVKMPPVDVEQLKAEDALENIKGELPPRFGQKTEVQISPKSHGEMAMLPNGDRVWRLALYSKDAFSINFLFDQFKLSPNSELFLYNTDKSYKIGAFTASNNKSDGMFATAPVKGERVIFELYEPKAEIGQSIVSISHVVHAYKNLFKLESPQNKIYGSSGACNIDVACPQSVGWEDQINSVALIIVNGSRNCTGSMVNNTAEDGKAYFLSANHCGTGMNNSWVYVFDYQSPTCGGADGDLSHSITGASLVSNYSPSDFTLAELSATPPVSYTVYYAGWDRTNDGSDGCTGIHHPAGDVMKISHNTDALYSGSWGSGDTNIPSGDHWVVDNWEEGTTEGGSSGSALFNLNKRIVGQLHGGGAACGNTLYDSYGKTFTSWTGGGASNSRLSDHLDPTNSGVNFIDGTFITPNDYDLAVSNIEGTEQDGCSTNLVIGVEIQNLGSTTVTSFELEYILDGVLQDSTVSGVNMITGDKVVIEVFNQAFTAGSYTLTTTASLPNGMTDENTANNSSSETWDVTAGQTFTVEIQADNYPGETSFDIKDDQGNVIVTESSITSGLNTFNYCLADGCYTFTIFDSYGDGLCCGYGNGSYSLYDGDGNVMATGGEFDDEEIQAFCYTSTCVASIYYVDRNATGTQDGESWANAFASIDQASNSIVAGECTEVWVVGGYYYPTNASRSSSIVLKNDIQYYGGFLAGMTERSQRDLVANPVILSGDINVQDDPSDNIYHVLSFDNTADTTCVVDGFTIVSGNADGSAADSNGAGIYNLGGSPILRNLIITANSCSGNGGAIYTDGGSPILENIQCAGNTSGNGNSIFVESGEIIYLGTNSIE